MTKQSTLKTIVIYSIWTIIWIIFLTSIHYTIGLDYKVINKMSFAFILAVSLLLKDIIFDFILEKTGTLAGWKSWYPWFEHLPLSFFLIILPIFIDTLNNSISIIAFIDFIIDGYQDIQYRKL